MERLKNVMLIWSLVYLLITALIYLLNQWLVVQPIYIRTLVLSGIMVFSMQYLVLPTLQKFRKQNK
ncbi:MAG: hypothetical protein AAFX87_19120 [Bacteroidota bacterium]